MREITKRFVDQISYSKHIDKIIAIYLYGSEARGEANLLSDVDLAIVSQEPLSVTERLTIVEEVSDELKEALDFRIVCIRPEQLQTTHKLEVGYSIAREGIKIYG